MNAATPSRRRAKNVTQYDFVDEPFAVTDSGPSSPNPSSAFGLNFPIASPGLRLSRGAPSPRPTLSPLAVALKIFAIYYDKRIIIY
jgi:hypothetical protein